MFNDRIALTKELVLAFLSYEETWSSCLSKVVNVINLEQKVNLYT